MNGAAARFAVHPFIASSVEFYHFEEGLLEKFDYEMEFDNADKTVASEKGSIDDNGGWEYTFYMGDGAITVTWQQSSQVYTRVTV